MIRSFYILSFVLIPALLHLESQGQPTLAAGKLHVVEARITDLQGRPAVGKSTYLTVAAPRYELRMAVSDQQGAVTFLIPDLGSKAQLIFQFDHLLDTNLIFTTEKSFVRLADAGVPLRGGYLYQDTSFFYGSPDKTYHLDDYTRFGTLEEAFREYVAEVRLTKQGENFKLRVINKPFNLYFDNPPLVLLDGIPVFDHNRVMQLDPLRIRTIDVIARRYYLGSLMCNGIVSLYSFDADMAGYSLPHRALVRDHVEGD